MEFKVLYRKDTDEFGVPLEQEIATCSKPFLFNVNMTIEVLKESWKNLYNTELDLSAYELRRIKLEFLD